MGQINRKRKRNNGFTLVELICVIAIMAILIAVAVPSYQNMQNKSAEQVALSNARSEYSAGKAQQALVDAQVLKPNETEAYNYDSGTDTATWEGEINGRTYTATFDGKSGEGTVNYKWRQGRLGGISCKAPAFMVQWAIIRPQKRWDG